MKGMLQRTRGMVGLPAFDTDSQTWGINLPPDFTGRPQQEQYSIGSDFHARTLGDNIRAVRKEEPTHQRCFWTTKRGYMGMSSAAVQSRDTVTVLLGCDVPVLMRKLQDNYVVIGECFCLGFMGGEALHMVEEGELEVQEFDIA
ncbi:MAG: hypothetical protein M1820_001745 [Bogoriella megaspora]|nr:MAG: hypothetical protein M1820_001745 [Bogoriella megaspora]